MSIKRFCDQCFTEMTEKNTPFGTGQVSGRLSASIGHLGVEVIQSQNKTSNSGDYCKYCILDALYKLDDRPRPA